MKSFLIYMWIFISLTQVVVATEENIDDEVEIKKKSKTLTTYICQERQSNFMPTITNTSSSHSFLSSKLFFRIMKYFNNNKETKYRTTNPILALPIEIIFEIAFFLDCFDQLKLFHANRELKNFIGEEFWERKIKQQGYLLWDQSLPKVKIFFANYLYEKGFGRHPNLSENIVDKTIDVSLLPSLYLAEKSLVLGFPKGRKNFRQVRHKITMMKKVTRINKPLILKQKYDPFLFLMPYSG